MDDYQPSPAARLIETGRKQAGASVRASAAEAGLSEGRWRQIAKGYQAVAKGIRAPVNAPPETLARMALAVGIAPSVMAAVDPEVGAVMDQLAPAERHEREHLAEQMQNESDVEFASQWLATGERPTPALPEGQDYDDASAPLARLYELRRALDLIIKDLELNTDAAVLPDAPRREERHEQLMRRLKLIAAREDARAHQTTTSASGGTVAEPTPLRPHRDLDARVDDLIAGPHAAREGTPDQTDEEEGGREGDESYGG